LRAPLAGHPALERVTDETLEELLTGVFFASLHAEESEHHPIRVAFVGSSLVDVVSSLRPETADVIYHWNVLRFQSPHPFEIRNLARIARAAASEQLYAKVALSGNELEIVGIAREGYRADNDPFLRIVAPEPGCIVVWRGQHRVLEYEHGRLRAVPENIMLSAGPVRRTLAAFARSAVGGHGVEDAYLDAVAGLVREMATHRRGGILVISPDDCADPPLGTGFFCQSSMSLMRLIERMIELGETSLRSRRRWRELVEPAELDVADSEPSDQILIGALHSEIERTISEIGGFTALDGATLLSRSLAVAGFGIILPTLRDVVVMEALGAEAHARARFPLHLHGARHRAAATYAATHPNSVVFMASEDGTIASMLREPHSPHVLLWRFRANHVSHG
jgi:hypothetical protein